MPELSVREHETVVAVMKQYVDSLDIVLRAHPMSQEARAKRHDALRILEKLNEPEPLVAALENVAAMSARLKLRFRR